jgi:hypothetical protein
LPRSSRARRAMELPRQRTCPKPQFGPEKQGGRSCRCSTTAQPPQLNAANSTAKDAAALDANTTTPAIPSTTCPSHTVLGQDRCNAISRSLRKLSMSGRTSDNRSKPARRPVSSNVMSRISVTFLLDHLCLTNKPPATHEGIISSILKSRQLSPAMSPPAEAIP